MGGCVSISSISRPVQRIKDIFDQGQITGDLT